MHPTLSLIVPCHNEADGIANLGGMLRPVVADLRRARTVELVLVDDGSADDTAALLQQTFGDDPFWAPVRIETHGVNRGLGAALATGFAAAQGEIICTLDADGTYRPAEVPGLVACLETHQADIACGSPYHPEGSVEGVPGWRLALSKSCSRLYALITRTDLYCYTGMFRAYRARWARSSAITHTGFLGVTEVLIRALQAGAHVVEYPVCLHQRQTGVSKMRVLHTLRLHLIFMSGLLLGASDANRAPSALRAPAPESKRPY